MKNEEFHSIEEAIKAGTAPQHVVDAFNEFSTLRGELKYWASRKFTTSKP
ncbi:MAG: hypothetical protein M3Y82_03255 [Verrucomicrobiota bacterium]|nr:hypothetical protein [Verrucomicrobiota bacterium]